MLLYSIIGGVLLGTFTGLIPGIHPNLIATTLTNLNVNNTNLIFLTALTHTFINTIPAIYLFSPEPSTSLLVHPAQKYNQEGKSHEAILLTLVGSLSSLLLIIALSPLILKIISPTQNILKNFIAPLILILSIYLVFSQRNKALALIVFILSGVLGYKSLNSNLAQPLLPLFTGLFGIPAIITNLKNKNKTKQHLTEPNLEKKDVKLILNSALIGSFFSFLPSLGPSQAATAQTEFTKKQSPKNYLIIIGCLNTIHILISILTAYKIEKARNGAVATILSITSLNTSTLITMVSLSLIVIFPITSLCIFCSRSLIKITGKINTKKILLMVFVFLIIINTAITGHIGLIILATATAIGIIPYQEKIRRTTLMGSLMIPTTLFYFSLTI